MEQKEALVKGTAVKNFETYINKELGDNHFKSLAVSSGLLEPHRMVMPITWYSFDSMLILTHNAARGLKMDHSEFLSTVVEFTLIQDLNSVYKFFIRFAGADNVLSKSIQISSTYCNFFNYEILENKPGCHTLRITVEEKYLEPTVSILKGAISGILKVCKTKLQKCDVSDQLPAAGGAKSVVLKFLY